jgi:hypothetical protein
VKEGESERVNDRQADRINDIVGERERKREREKERKREREQKIEARNLRLVEGGEVVLERNSEKDQQIVAPSVSAEWLKSEWTCSSQFSCGHLAVKIH